MRDNDSSMASVAYTEKTMRLNLARRARAVIEAWDDGRLESGDAWREVEALRAAIDRGPIHAG